MLLSIFFVLLAIIALTLTGYYRTAVLLYFVNLVLGGFAIWEHMTNTLKING